MKKVLDKYTEQISRIYTRSYERQQGVLTTAQQNGIAYYRAAIQTLQALIDAPRPAWYDFKFEKKLY